jgi:hypothetical protein
VSTLTRSFSQCNFARERNKRHTNRKGGNKTIPVCRRHDSHIEKLETRKLLEMVSGDTVKLYNTKLKYKN